MIQSELTDDTGHTDWLTTEWALTTLGKEGGLGSTISVKNPHSCIYFICLSSEWFPGPVLEPEDTQ